MTKIDDRQSFVLWANVLNHIFHGGYPLIHPEYHYHLCESGVMKCYLGMYQGVPASVVSVHYHDDTAAVYHLGTLEGFKKKGLAKAVCSEAIGEAFSLGSKIVTSIVWPDGKHLADSLEFKAY